MYLNTGVNCDHCFCKNNPDGSIECCKCDAKIIQCASCKISFCMWRSYHIKHVEGPELFTIDCPLASGRYVEMRAKPRSL